MIPVLKDKEHFRYNLLRYVIVYGGIGCLVLCFVILQGLIIAGYSDARRDVAVMKGNIAEVSSKLHGDMEPYSRSFSSVSLKKIYTSEELATLTQKYWDYTLLINGFPLSSENVHVMPGDITISLCERQSTTLLPDDIVAYGRIAGGDKEVELGSYISITGDAELDYSSKKEDLTTKATYKVKGAAAGDVIPIHLHFTMMERLGLETPEIQVVVNE